MNIKIRINNTSRFVKGVEAVKKRGKSINLYLIDGEVTGRIKCTLANWTGLAYKIPRTELEESRDRIELKQSGVYFLFGMADDMKKDVVYIGQAQTRKNGKGVLGRIREHHDDKDYWTEAVILTTSNNSFGPTEISYLENRFYSLAIVANRLIIKNNNEPNLGNITEEKESELEDFIDYSKIVLGALGYKLFEPVIRDDNEQENDEPQLIYETQKAFAYGMRTNEGFVVRKGSKISRDTQPSCPKNAVRLREEESNNITENGILRVDILLSSPSTAAAFVSGYSASGNDVWKDQNGKSLGEIEIIKNKLIN